MAYSILLESLMANTPLGYFQRTDKGRFLYGRCKNYRLAAGLTNIPNPYADLGTTDPLAGTAPLDVDNDIGEYTTLPVVPDPMATLPVVNGMTVPNPGGGYAVTGTGYARENNPTPITPVNTWNTGEGEEAGGGSESTTPYTYDDPGSYDSSLVMTDCLSRSSVPQETGPVVVSA